MREYQSPPVGTRGGGGVGGRGVTSNERNRGEHDLQWALNSIIVIVRFIFIYFTTRTTGRSQGRQSLPQNHKPSPGDSHYHNSK